MSNPNLAPSTIDTTAVTPATPNVYRRTSRELLLKRMALVGMIGTVALSAIATELHGNIKGFYEAAKATLVGDNSPDSVKSHLNIDPRLSSVTIFGQKLPYPDVKVSLDATQTKEGVPKTQIAEPEAHLAMPWAHEFSKDPAARDVTEARRDVRPLIANIHHYEQQGYVIDAVEIQGFASDEVDKPGAGLDQHNPANMVLANTRAKAAEEAVVGPEMAAHGYNLPIDILHGKEVIDPAVNAEVEKLAAERGMDVDSYIKAFNRHDMEFSQHELHSLNHYVDDRYVKVVLKMHRELPQVESQHQGGDFILVPFLIPLWRKRKIEAVEPKPKPRVPRPVYPRAQNDKIRNTVMTHRRPEIIKQPRGENFHNGKQRARGQGRRISYRKSVAR